MAAMRDELVWLREQLDADPDAITEPFDSADHTKAVWRLMRRVFFAALAVGVGGFLVEWWFESDQPKRTPFEAVRWQDSDPEVRIDSKWFRLVAIDGVAAEEVITFSKETYGDAAWRQRFAEDLVEVLTRMGHEPGGVVRLLVTPIGSDLEFMQKTVPLTDAARSVIERAAAAREAAGRPRADARD